jgi:hypothetical protein
MKHQKVDPLTKAMILQVKNQVTKEVMEETFKLLLGLPVLALRDEFEFGKKRNSRFIERMLSIYDSYSRGDITLDDIEAVLEEETGLNFADFRGDK